jgi:dolichol-phosphate mannosyltransferase
MPSRCDRSECLHLMNRGQRPFDAEHRHPRTVLARKILSRIETTERSFLSVVIPAKNEAASLAQLIDEIAWALRPLCDVRQRELVGFEIVVVDDASQDSTQLVLESLTVAYPELKTLVLARSAGQSGATMAGIHAARGEWIATLDADLQNDPVDLVRLWRARRGHHSAVLGWRVKRQDVWSKRMVSFWANRLRNLVLNQSIRDTGCSIRIFPRRLALRLPMFYGMHRFFGSLLLREGCDLVQLPVRHRIRSHGRSHYNCWNRSFHVIVDLLGVAWLISRPVHCRVVKTRDSAGMRESRPEISPHIGIERIPSRSYREN